MRHFGDGFAKIWPMPISEANVKQLKNSLKHEWYQRGSHPFLIVDILLAEFLDQDPFFGAGLEVERDEPGKQEGESAHGWEQGQIRAEQSQDETGVERVTDDVIWAALDKFVIFLDDHKAAPVPAQDAPCPNGQSQAGRAERDAE